MYLPESEAAKKWCPFARIYRIVLKPEAPDNFVVGTPSVNRESDNSTLPEACKCIASACASWRWHPSVTRAPNGRLIERERKGAKLVPVEPRGYCGLAGKPSGDV